MLTFIESGCKLHERAGWLEKAVVYICPIGLLEFEPLRNDDAVRSSMLKGIRAKRNRATTFIGHQGRNLKVVK